MLTIKTQYIYVYKQNLNMICTLWLKLCKTMSHGHRWKGNIKIVILVCRIFIAET